MKRLALVVPFLFAPACGILATNPETGETALNYSALHRELDLLERDAEGWADAFEASGDQDTADSMRAFASAVASLNAAVAAASSEDGEAVDLAGAIQFAIDSLDELVAATVDDPDKRASLQVWVVIAQSLFRRVQAYAVIQ